MTRNGISMWNSTSLEWVVTSIFTYDAIIIYNVYALIVIVRFLYLYI